MDKFMAKPEDFLKVAERVQKQTAKTTDPELRQALKRALVMPSVTTFSNEVGGAMEERRELNVEDGFIGTMERFLGSK